MPYVSRDDLIGMVPKQFLFEALDDDGGGAPDADIWPQVDKDVTEDINGRLLLEQSPVPIPTILKAAAKQIAACFVLRRRQIPDENNPFATPAKRWQDRLDRVGRGEESLEAADTSESGAVVTEDAKTYNPTGGLMV